MSFQAGGFQAGISAMTRLRAIVPWLVPMGAMVLMPAGAVAAAGGPLSHGGPQMTLRQTPSPAPPGGRTPTGIHSIAPTGQALSGALDQMTGLTPSEVQAQDVCPPVGPGVARCAAQALVLQSSHRLVRPDVVRSQPLARGPGSAHPAVASPAATPAVSQPAVGTPAFLQQAYDLSYLSQAGGRGDTVAVIDAYDDPKAESDLATFRSTSGLPACTTANGCFRKVNQSGAASPVPAHDSGWEQEISLDLDAISALCPNCHILLVEAGSSMANDLTAAMQTARRWEPSSFPIAGM